MKIQLNDAALELKQSVAELSGIGFSSCGFFMRMAIEKIARDLEVTSTGSLWIKNPEITFFDDFRTAMIGNDTNATSSDMIYGTSAIYFKKINNLPHFTFQMFGSFIASKGLSSSFRACAFREIGSCRFSEQVRIPESRRDSEGRRDSIFTAWAERHLYVVCQLKTSGDGFFIHVGHGDIPEAINSKLIHSADNVSSIFDIASFFDALDKFVV